VPTSFAGKMVEHYQRTPDTFFGI